MTESFRVASIRGILQTRPKVRVGQSGPNLLKSYVHEIKICLWKCVRFSLKSVNLFPCTVKPMMKFTSYKSQNWLGREQFHSSSDFLEVMGWWFCCFHHQAPIPRWLRRWNNFMLNANSNLSLNLPKACVSTNNHSSKTNRDRTMIHTSLSKITEFSPFRLFLNSTIVVE